MDLGLFIRKQKTKSYGFWNPHILRLGYTIAHTYLRHYHVVVVGMEKGGEITKGHTVGDEVGMIGCAIGWVSEYSYLVICV